MLDTDMTKTAMTASTPTEPFRIGDHVTWASQANGVTRIKTGIIVGVIPPETVLWRFLQRHDASLSCYDQSPIDARSGSRLEVSYLVAVTMQTRTGKIVKRQRLYWPRVTSLHLQGATQ